MNLRQQKRLMEINMKAKPVDFIEGLIGPTLKALAMKTDLVGSYATVSPPVKTTDIDVLCLVDYTTWVDFCKVAIKEGFLVDDDYEGIDSFTSFRRGKVNIISTLNIVFYAQFICARNVCKRLNLMDKKARIKVHDEIIGFKYMGQTIITEEDFVDALEVPF